MRNWKSLLLAFLLLPWTAVSGQAGTGNIVGWTSMVERYHMGNGRADEFRRIYVIRTPDRRYEFIGDEHFSVGQKVEFEVRQDEMTITRPDGKTKKYRLWSDLPADPCSK